MTALLKRKRNYFKIRRRGVDRNFSTAGGIVVFRQSLPSQFKAFLCQLTLLFILSWFTNRIPVAHYGRFNRLVTYLCLFLFISFIFSFLKIYKIISVLNEFYPIILFCITLYSLYLRPLNMPTLRINGIHIVTERIELVSIK